MVETSSLNDHDDGIVQPLAKVGKASDIGCGMLSVQTTLKREELDEEALRKVFGGSKEYPGGIRSSIPVGFNHHSKKQDEQWMPAGDWPLPTDDNYMTAMKICEEQYEAALKQVGTLGGGNHFIEFQYDENDNIWFTIHSGSRNLGKRVADYYNDIAKKLNAKWHSSIDPKWDLAFLPVDIEEGRCYLDEMHYCVEFALKSRELMAFRIKESLTEVFPHINWEPAINIAHNYAKKEEHYGKYVYVHRKGATYVGGGLAGIIPGSQGSSTFIVKGTGNKESFYSCSHGAGRKMGRKQAQRTLNLEEERKKMSDAGVILHGLRGEKDLDEAPGSYKDINVVMENQKDLVDVVHTLRPIAVMKG